MASSLGKKIRVNPEYVGRNEAGDGISDLKALASAAARTVGEAWSKAIADRCELLRAGIAVAELAGAGAVAGLREKLALLQSRRLPSSQSEVQEVARAFAQAEAAVATVGASQQLSSFIEDARRGMASARRLDDPEVRAFLNAQQLWPRLTVKLT